MEEKPLNRVLLTSTTQKTSSIEAIGIRFVVIILVKSVHQLTDKIGRIACFLHPRKKPVIVKALVNEFVPATYA